MIANAPVVFFGDAITRRVPIKVVHVIAALIFAALGVLALLGVGASLTA
jgi:Ca2+/H+ antiporter, TMEM165/GDT1 family